MFAAKPCFFVFVLTSSDFSYFRSFRAIAVCQNCRILRFSSLLVFNLLDFRSFRVHVFVEYSFSEFPNVQVFRAFVLFLHQLFFLFFPPSQSIFEFHVYNLSSCLEFGIVVFFSLFSFIFSSRAFVGGSAHSVSDQVTVRKMFQQTMCWLWFSAKTFLVS